MNRRVRPSAGALTGALTVASVLASRAWAQQDIGGLQDLGRLTVTKAMATGTSTAAAGTFRLDSLYPGDTLLKRAYLYVPERCVGKKRCPLVLLLHGGQGNGLTSIQGDDGFFSKYADSIGYLLLAPTGPSGGWDFFKPNSIDLPLVDAAMRTVLEHFAVNPKRIIATGGSQGTGGAVYLGYTNGDLFSHILGFEGWTYPKWTELKTAKPHGKTKFFLALSKDEVAYIDLPAFEEWLRAKGYSIDHAPDNGTHAMTWERGKTGYDWLARNGAWR